jgi:succinate dehydrogenase / fumarate reductase cytochrome b subunit
MKRPLSPHLQIYRLPLAALLSITHRLTGVGLIFVSIGFLYWLWAVAMGGGYYTTALWLFSSPMGKLGLFFTLFAFYYHLSNGIRHLVWDFGRGFSLTTTQRSNWVVIAAAVVLTLFTWV